MKRAHIAYSVLLVAWGVNACVVNVNALSAASLPSMAALANGSAPAAFEKGYREGVFYRDVAQNSYGSLRFLAFGEGRKGVIVGSDGWLFSAEELEEPRGSDTRKATHIGFISQTVSDFRKSGTQLVVALIPEKTDIYAEKLDNKITGDFEYAAVRDSLISNGVTVPDLRHALLAGKANAPVFLRTDTHWTPEGAGIVAAELARVHGPVEDLSFETKAAAPLQVEGDLTRYLSISGLSVKDRYDVETIKRVELLELEPIGGDLFTDTEIPVALVGTSYSADERWGFEASLKKALKSDILNVAEEGKGPFEPMHAYVKSEALANHPPKLVVWEIPLRYFTVSPNVTPGTVEHVLSASVTP